MTQISLAKEAALAQEKVADDLSDGRQIYHMLSDMTMDLARAQERKEGGKKLRLPEGTTAGSFSPQRERSILIERYGNDKSEFHQWTAVADGPRKVVITYKGKLSTKK